MKALILIALLATPPAFAKDVKTKKANDKRMPAASTNYTHQCVLDDNFDDWTVRVGPANGDLFDNDTNCALRLIKREGQRATYTSINDRCNDKGITFEIDVQSNKAQLSRTPPWKIEGKSKKSLSMSCKKGTWQDD